MRLRELEYIEIKEKLFGLWWIEERIQSDDSTMSGVCNWFDKYKILHKITIMDEFLEDK